MINIMGHIVYKSNIVYKIDDLQCCSMYYKLIRGQINKYIELLPIPNLHFPFSLNSVLVPPTTVMSIIIEYNIIAHALHFLREL